MSARSEKPVGRNRLRLAVDGVMALTLALLLNARVFTGLSFHEIAGTLIGGVFVLHVGLNGSWVVETSRRWVRGTLSRRTRVGYGLNWLLLVGMGVIVASGLLISRVVFPGLHVTNGRWIRGTHITLGFLILGVVGVHVGLHWGWIRGWVTRGFVGMSWPRRIGAVLGVVGLMALLAFGGVPTGGPSAEVGSRSVPADGEPGLRHGEAKAAKDRSTEFRQGGGRRGIRSNPLAVVTYYLGILSVFAAGTVWVERRLRTADADGEG